MCASPLSFFRSGPPPPRVALLPDALFFTRVVPVTAGATPAEAAAQIEIALEAVAPFPLAQLYYGSFWVPGAEEALVFAAYRRRFTSDQTAEWGGSELVLPVFAALAGAKVEPATTLLVPSLEGLTAIHWEKSPVPAKVIFRPLPPEATDEARAQVREELLRAIGGSRKVVDLAEPLQADPATTDREVAFHAGDVKVRFPATVAAGLDVRDKGELAALRQARKRDVLLWRFTLGSAAALLLLGLGELGMVGGKFWQRGRDGLVQRQTPIVERIRQQEALARRIEDLANKRLLPLEMITILTGKERERLPAEIWFNRILTSPQTGIYSVSIEATTNNSAQVSAYQATLNGLPAIERVEVGRLDTRNNITTFTLTVTFKPEALRPSA